MTRVRKDRTITAPPPGGRLTPGQQLSAAMREHDLNQTILAREVGVQQPTVSLWENGKARPGPKRAAQIEELTGMPREIWRDEAIIEAVEKEAQKWRDVGATGSVFTVIIR